MSGSKEGGKKASETLKKLYGEDYYQRIGQMGGLNGTTGGFASDKVGEDGLTGRQRARLAGIKGGKVTKKDFKNHEDA